MTVTTMLRAACLAALALAAAPAAARAAECAEMNTTALMDLPGAPVTVTAAVVVPPADGAPRSCRVAGFVAPQVAFEVRLPQEGWNGKLLVHGCGGMCGIIDLAHCADVLARDYAVATTDMGHQGDPSTTSWALGSLQARIDFGYRATHVTTVAARALVERFYGRAPARTYFRGCSTGGRQALVEAEKFPEDFDGIIAGAPPIDETGDAAMHLIWSARAAMDADGRALLTPDMLKTLHEAALSACGADAQGVIQDPGACAFDPAAARCGADAGGGCLPPEAVAAAARIYAGAHDASGRRLFPGGMVPGSELEWTPAFVQPPGARSLWLGPKAAALVRFTFLLEDPGPQFSLLDADLEELNRRMAIVEPLYDARDPDLSAFRAHGGKLILFHGWDDVEVPARMSLDFYKRAAAAAGGIDAARSFFRLFLVPGMAHCRRGPGGDAIDYLSALEAWSERGEAPDSLLAFHPVQPQNYGGLPPVRFPMDDAAFAWSRPVFAYPQVARYAGAGDPLKPGSWAAGPAGE